MKLRTLICGIVFGAGTVLLSGPAVTRAGDPSNDRDLIEKLRQAARPSTYHKNLKTIKARYGQTIKWWRAPDAEPSESEGKSDTERILDGRFVTQRVKGMWLGTPFEGLGTLGYDNGTQEYVLVWMDSLSTRTLVSRGTCDESGQTITLHGEYHDPISGQMRKIKTVLQILNKKGETLLEVYDVTSPGREFKFLEVDSKQRVATAA